jgi:predicted unusual protein kinase regulating ubiquinone biosynthesis (AarF/ABC1/UbiB family)
MAKDSEERALPHSRWSRLASLARVTASTAGQMLSKGRDATASAEAAANILGNMRGLAAKIGQMGSYIDGVVPPEHAAAYETAMRGLQAAAGRSAFADVRSLIEAELGHSIESLFAEFDEAPLASASIGQVHRARLKDGREVAVKVQHTHIQEAVEADLANAGVLKALVGASLGSNLNVKRAFDVVRQRFREELDYELEAERQMAFRKLHAGDSAIVIPEVIADYSRKRVITSELLRGQSLMQAAEASENERRIWAETMWRFVFRGTLIGRMFNADPHPGNYFFLSDGRVGFIDFGCVQPLAQKKSVWAINAHRAAGEKDEEGFAKAISQMLTVSADGSDLAVPNAPQSHALKSAVQYTRSCFEPLFCSPYRITRSWAASLVTGMKDLAAVMRKADKRDAFQPADDVIFMNRLQFGFYSVLARLDVEVDYYAQERTFLPTG